MFSDCLQRRDRVGTGDRNSSQPSYSPSPLTHYRLPITIELSHLTIIQGIDSVHG
ncbi:MAG: hypothetical protein AB4290_19265 [Spirulina sp.]